MKLTKHGKGRHERDDPFKRIEMASKLMNQSEKNGYNLALKEVFTLFQSAISNQQLAKMETDDCFITVEEFRLAKQKFGVK